MFLRKSARSIRLGHAGCEFILLALFHQHYILETLSKPIPGLGMNRHYSIRIDLLNGPGDVLALCMARGMVTPLKAQIPFLVHREPTGVDVEALQPVPQPPEINLHLLVESLARRVNIGTAIWFYVQKVFHVEKGEAQNVVLWTLTNRFVIHISISVESRNNFLLPFSFRPVHDLAVDPKPVGHARSIDALQVMQHVDILGHGHQLSAGLLGYLLEGLQPLEVSGREVGYN
jgi:hypothetical protein